jgi:hypothetical protein
MDERTGEAKSEPKTTAKNRAQAEFERFKARTGATSAPFVAPLGFTASGPVPAWAFPPSLAALPPTAGGAGGGFPVTGIAAGSLGERLNTTLVLGLDLLNAGLAGGIRLLGGLSGVATGLGAGAWPGPDAHHGACDPGHGGHGACDCCCVMGTHGDCQPSVGTCC